MVDIFAGSNTAGVVAEAEGRRWLAFEERREYVAASAFRFLTENTPDSERQELYDEIMSGQSVEMDQYARNGTLFA